jgi:hypothetical protein
MKSTRARFKYALRNCRVIESRARADAIAKKLLTKDDASFWKDVKKMSSSSGNVLSSMVDDVVGEEYIANMWQRHYGQLLNSNKDVTCRKRVLDSLQNITGVSEERCNVGDITEAIKYLKADKSPGLDTLQAEHYKLADPVLQCLLAMLINCIITHGYLPDGAMDTVIIPILKDKKGLLTEKNNYRPLAVTSVFSKVLERIILAKYDHLLHTSSNQFGFKSGHSTDLCVFTLKQVIEFYNNLSSPIYVCFLDASKAFDRLNHWILFSKLLDRGIPLVIVRLFVFWYSCQKFCVRWGNTISSKFLTSNGVRQGGIISPIYFNMYMDGLSDMLNDSKIGCTINGQVINHLMYADDSCIVASSPSGLQQLLDLCCQYAEYNSIIYNDLKTKCMCFKPKSLRRLSVPAVYLNSKRLSFVSDLKYLGIIIKEDLSDNCDMIRHKKYLYVKGNMLLRNFKLCSDDVKHKLLKTFCYNVYGGHLWTVYNTQELSKLTVAYNDIYRKLFKIKRGVSMSAIYVCNNMDTFKVLLRKAAYRFRMRLMKSTNQYVQLLMMSVYFNCQSSFSQLWARILYT